MKTIIIVLFTSVLSLSCTSQETLKKVGNDNLFDIFYMLNVNSIEEIDTQSDYFAKIIHLYSDTEISFDDEGHEKKAYFFILVADYGEKPEGVLLKSKLLNYPKYMIRHIQNDVFEINITHIDEDKNAVEEKILCNSQGVIEE